MNNEAKRLNVSGLLGVSDFCISIDGNKKSVGEFIEFRGLSGKAVAVFPLSSLPIHTPKPQLT